MRKAKHAGSWYSKDDQVLRHELEEYLPNCKLKGVGIRGIIAPHAGYRFSGPVAGAGYSYLKNGNFKTIFILGPSHHVYLRGCALSMMKEYETPLGNLKLELNIIQQLKQSGKFETMDVEMDEDEHSIEMQLPFLKLVAKDARIVPIMVGTLLKEDVQEFARILLPYLEDENNGFVISSDFCHYGQRFGYQPFVKAEMPYKKIEQLDKTAIQIIQARDGLGFAKYLNETKNTICGRFPIRLMLAMLELQKDTAVKIQLAKYEQSSACKLPEDVSVSYASMIIYK